MDSDIKLAEKGLISGDLSMPSHLYPYEKYAPESDDPWDKWETDRYLKNLPYAVAYWNKCISTVRRQKKLELKRKLNSSYCVKNEDKYSRILKYKNVRRDLSFDSDLD